MKSFIIINANVVTPAGVINNASVLVENGIITAVNDQIDQHKEIDLVIDANNDLVMPGIIDLHTDALDGEIIPRPGADIPIQIAFKELERKMSGCGFTTVYHSLHLGYIAAETHSRTKYPRHEVFEKVNRAIN